MATPNIALPTTPGGATDISIAYNAAMQRLDALCQIGVEGVEDDPPVTTIGDVGLMFLVGSTPTGSFIGHEDEVALCTGENLWTFFSPGVVKYLLNKGTAGFYMWDGASWSLAGGLGDAPSDGESYVRKDGAWAIAPVAPAETVDVETPSNVSGTVTLDFAGKNKYVGKITLSANATLAFSNLPATGQFAEYELDVTQNGTGGFTLTLPASHKAIGASDTAIAAAANATTVISASTKDDGVTWRYVMQESA